MSVIDDSIRDSLRALSDNERRAVGSLLETYDIALRRIERDLITIERQIQEAIRRGVDVDDRWLHRQRWWREVEASIEAEMARWSGGAQQSIASLQSGGVSVALDASSAIARAVGTSPFQGRVYAGAFERWVSVLQPGSPLNGVLNSYGGEITAAARRRMTEGLGTGKAPRTIVREIMRDVAGEANEARLMTMARTESMRAYRGASADTMGVLQQRGVVSGYVWLAALSPRTCLACLERHGTFYEQYPDGFHPNCRCVARAVANPAIVPDGGWQGETGEQWLRRQPLKAQRQVMLTPGRLKMFQGGEPLSTFVMTRPSETWGPTIGIRPMREVRRKAA